MSTETALDPTPSDIMHNLQEHIINAAAESASFQNLNCPYCFNISEDTQINLISTRNDAFKDHEKAYSDRCPLHINLNKTSKDSLTLISLSTNAAILTVEESSAYILSIKVCSKALLNLKSQGKVS